jgi:hypothetical protein
MSYLGALRLHFAGQFQANVSTVNNDPDHFDNAAFRSSYQDMQTATAANGWFNPQGDAAFRLKGCVVTSAWTPGGEVTAQDPVLAYMVADSDGSVPAKLVDLDSEQQLVSTIWGLEVRIADAAGRTLLRGSYKPAAFSDIWDRASSGGGDIGAGAAYQSVLHDLDWGDVSDSPFLTALRGASVDSGDLSIKFMVDGLSMDFNSPDFMCGRIVGTIGPAAVDEPRHFIAGRQFADAGVTSDKVNFFFPVGGINFCPAVVDEAASAIYLDLGNALATAEPGGAINDLGDLTVAVFPRTEASEKATIMVPCGVVASGGSGGYAGDAAWYARTAGIVALPLEPQQLAMASALQISIMGAGTQTSGHPIVISERPAETFIRADTYVYRMSPGDTLEIPVYATRWGRPLVGAEVTFTMDNSQLQAQVGPDQFPYVAASPNVGTPPDALTFAPTARTNTDGVAILRVTAVDPGTPRWFGDGADYGVDGQVYGIRPAFVDPVLADGPVNQWDFISFLVWSSFTPATPVTWTDVQPIVQQYANLYPVMMRFLDLADYDQLRANADLLKLVFSLPITDPNTMPVTRDLSPAKRKAILDWLDDPLPGEVMTPHRQAVARQTDPEPVSMGLPVQGGKAAASARRLVVQTRVMEPVK